ncbi:MAG: hypothetical protein ABUS57_07930 [Pseudomonadota bacterium]
MKYAGTGAFVALLGLGALVWFFSGLDPLWPEGGITAYVIVFMMGAPLVTCILFGAALCGWSLINIGKQFVELRHDR